MLSAFDNLARLQNQNEVRVRDRLKVMSDHETGFGAHQTIQCLAHLRFALHVEACHRLVQDQDRGVADQRARDGDALLLAARKSGAAFADDRVITILQFANELVGICGCRGGHDLLEARLGFSIGDVLPDGRPEQDRFLEDDPDLPTQRLTTISLDIDPINENGPSLRFIEPQEQTDQGGLARPGDTHQGHSLARRNRKRNIFQDVPAVSVIK